MEAFFTVTARFANGKAVRRPLTLQAALREVAALVVIHSLTIEEITIEQHDNVVRGREDLVKSWHFQFPKYEER